MARGAHSQSVAPEAAFSQLEPRTTRFALLGCHAGQSCGHTAP
jgi:hypothetical protein